MAFVPAYEPPLEHTPVFLDPHDPLNQHGLLSIIYYDTVNLTISPIWRGTRQDIPLLHTRQDIPLLHTRQDFPLLHTRQGIPLLHTRQDIPPLHTRQDILLLHTRQDIPRSCTPTRISHSCTHSRIYGICTCERAPAWTYTCILRPTRLTQSTRIALYNLLWYC